jgi:hypothetical protein
LPAGRKLTWTNIGFDNETEDPFCDTLEYAKNKTMEEEMKKLFNL